MPAEAKRTASSRLAIACVLALLGSCMLSLLAVLLFAQRPTWKRRMAEQIEAGEIRRDCDALMANTDSHGTYWSPQSDGVGRGHPPLDTLPVCLRGLNPDSVGVSADHVITRWRGDALTEFGLVVFREGAEPDEPFRRGAERVAPRVWVYVD